MTKEKNIKTISSIVKASKVAENKSKKVSKATTKATNKKVEKKVVPSTVVGWALLDKSTRDIRVVFGTRKVALENKTDALVLKKAEIKIL